MQRPDQFTRNASHPLAQGLVFAGLGAHAGSTRYHDSSAYGNTCTLTNMEPATDWVFDWSRNIYRVDFDGSNDYMIQTKSFGNGSLADFSLSFLMKTTTSTQNIYALGVFEDGTTGAVDVGVNTLDGTIGSLNSLRVIVRDSAAGTYNKSYTSATWRDGNWHLHTIVRVGSTVTVYLDAVAQSMTSTADTLGTGAIAFARPMAFGARNVRGTIGGYSAISLANIFTHTRAVSDVEMRMMIDPSNVMLSGLIQPPRRKWWPVVSGAPATNRRRRLLIAGVGR